MNGDHWASCLIVALLREDEAAVRRLVGMGGDWDRLFEIVDRHRIGSYIATLVRPVASDGPKESTASRLLSEPLPEQVLAGLEERRRQISYENLLLMAHARPLLDGLRQRGIVPLVLKGCTMFGRVYADLGARHIVDIDLLVPEKRAAEACELLERQGMSHMPDTQRAARRTGYETEGPGSVAVEIHWDLSQRHRYQADLEGVWRRSIPFEFEGVPARRMAPADEFVYLALHHAAHYFGVTVKWIVDLRELLRRDPPEPEEAIARAREWRGEAGLHFALQYLRRVYLDPAAVDPSSSASFQSGRFIATTDGNGAGAEFRIAERIARSLAMPWRDRIIVPYLSEDPLFLVTERRRGAGRLLMGLLFVDRPLDMVRLGWVTLVKRGEEHEHGPQGRE